MSARTIHPFPAKMAPEIALNAIPPIQDSQLTILDPMCGSGTVLTVALSRGHQAIGIDIDPLAVMMSRVAVAPVDVSKLMQAGSRALAHARAHEGRAPWGDDTETDDFVTYWFGKKQRQELTALVSAIQRQSTNAIRLALMAAVSRIIVTKSPQASLAADTSHSRPHRVVSSSNYDVFMGFQRSLEQLARKLAARPEFSGAKVILGDARGLQNVRPASIDMVVTSPPYLNALDYLRGHKLALVWFGYTVSDLRERRSTSIGSERNLGVKPSEVVAGMVDSIEASVVDKSLLKRGMVERFAQDCLGFAGELSRVMKDDGTAVLVVGNSTLRGNYIRNDLITQLAMEHAGFRVRARYERDIPPTKRYMAIDSGATSTISKRMRTEVVLTMGR